MDFKGSSSSTTPMLHTYQREYPMDPPLPPSFTEYTQYADVYKPMLSECIGDMSNSDMKLHDQWIVRRKRIIYFLTIATVFAVVLCAISLIYVLPNLYGDQGVSVETKNFEEPSHVLEDDLDDPQQQQQQQQQQVQPDPIQFTIEPIPIKIVDEPRLDDDLIFPPMSEAPPNPILNDGSNSDDSPIIAQIPTLQGDDYSKLTGEESVDDFYVFCVISAIPRYQKYSKTCNSVVFREVETVDPTLYFTNDDLDVNAIINVRITSPLSEHLVEKVLGIFPNIQKLTVCIDQLCFGQKEKDIENLPVINLPNVDTLEIVNSTLCPLASWVFNKWTLPSIEKLTIIQANFPRKVYQSLGNFFERHHDTLTSVDLKSCQCGRQLCNNALTPGGPTGHTHRHHHHHRTTSQMPSGGGSSTETNSVFSSTLAN